MQCHGGADGTKSNGGVAYRFLITILDKRFVYKLLIEMANKLRRSMHRRASVPTIALFYKPPSSPFLCVTFRQSALHQNYEYSKEGSEIYLQ